MKDLILFFLIKSFESNGLTDFNPCFLQFMYLLNWTKLILAGKAEF